MLAPRRDAFQGLRNQVSGLASRRVNAQEQVPSATIPTQNAQVQSLMMPPELQRIQAMALSYQLKLQNDSFLQGIRQQQQQLQSAVQQRQGSYLNSIQQFFNTAPPELKRFLSSPRVMQNISMAYADSQQLQPEFAQMRDLSQQYNQYVQTNYGEEQRRLQELQQQAAPQIQQYQNQMFLFNQQQQLRGPQGQTPPIVRNNYDYLPEGLTQEQFMRQSRGIMDQQYRTPEQMREYFKPLYDSYLEEKRMATAQNKAVQSTPLPTQNPYTSTTAVDSTGTPITGIQPVQQPTVKPIVDPIRTPTFRPPTPVEQPPARPSGVAPGETPDPKREVKRIAPVAITQRQDPIVDPIREPLIAKPAVKKPTFIGHSGSNDPTGGLPALEAPGLGNKPKQRKSSSIRPSQYTDLNTSVKGLMNNGV